MDLVVPVVPDGVVVLATVARVGDSRSVTWSA